MHDTTSESESVIFLNHEIKNYSGTWILDTAYWLTYKKIYILTPPPPPSKNAEALCTETSKSPSGKWRFHCAEIVIGLEANGAFILPDTRHIQMPTKLATILYKQFLPVSISVYATVNTNYYFIRNKRFGSNHTNRDWDLQKMACIELHGVVHTAPRHWYYWVL